MTSNRAQLRPSKNNGASTASPARDDAAPSSFNVDSFSVGQLRTSGAWIGLMLQAESAGMRKRIIVDLINAFELDFDDLKKLSLTGNTGCIKCGMSMYGHDDSGRCPYNVLLE